MTIEISPRPAPESLKAASVDFQRDLRLGKATHRFPGVYGPRDSASFQQYVDQLAQLPAEQVHHLLQSHGGALLFRGFGTSSAQEFSDFVHALHLGPQPHAEVGRPPRRTVLAKGVSTANEGPPTAPIWVHNEYGWSKVYPGFIVFFALKTPDEGGETPINSGIELAARLEKEIPEFYESLAAKGLQYVYRYTWNDNPLSNVGTSVLDAYGQEVKPGDDEATIKRKVEVEIAKHSNDFEWHEDRSLSVWHRVPAIRVHRAQNLPAFFGNVISAYERAKHFGALEPPYLGTDKAYHPIPRYGDGSEIKVEHLDQAAEIVKETHVLVAWQEGDVLVLDNHAVQHARCPWKGERRVLASLWDGPAFPDQGQF